MGRVTVMSSVPGFGFLRRRWRAVLLLAGLLVVGVVGVRGYRFAKEFLRPSAPEQVAQVEIPDDVTKVGEAISKAMGEEMVLSGDDSLRIDEVSPSSGPPGTLVTVTGAGFGPEQGYSAVAVNMTEAVPALEVVEWSDTQVRFHVPEHATSGEVTVTRWDFVRMEQIATGAFRPVCKNPRPSNGITFTVTGQEERIALGKAIFFGWTQLNEEAASLVHIPKERIAVDPQRYVKYGFLPRNDKGNLVDEGEAERFSTPTSVLGVRIKKGVDGQLRVGYACAYCHTGRDPATGEIVPGIPSTTLQFGKLISMATNLSEEERNEAAQWPAGTADLTFRYFPDHTVNPTAILLARGVHGLRFWSSAGMAMPEYQRHSNAWKMQGSPYMAPLKVSIALTCYLSSLEPIKNPHVDPEKVRHGEALFHEFHCATCHSPAQGLYTNQRVIPFDLIGSNGPPTGRMKDSGGIRVSPLLSNYATPPYLHDNSVATLDDLLDPARLVPGSPIYKQPHTPHPPHPFVVLDPVQRGELVEFLKSL
jgi:hypothetical protein